MTPFVSEYSWVTKNALVSVASDGSRRVILFFSSSGCAASIDSCASGVVSGSASAPFSRVLSRSTMPPVYSGTTSTLPLVSSPRYWSRLFTSFCSTV